MSFDPQSVALIALLICLAFGTSLIGLSRHHGAARALPLQIWSRALILAPLGWLVLELSRSYGPLWLAVPGKALIMAGFVEYWRALRAFCGRPAGAASFVLVIPADFERDVVRGRQPQLFAQPGRRPAQL